MQDTRPKISIMRWINYHDAGKEQFERSTRYIFKDRSSPSKYRGNYHLSVSNPGYDLEVIQNRWKPRGSRLFKHGVISFGIKDLAAEKAMEVTDEILEIYRDYPMLFAIHTDIPHRIHSHFIMGMTNVFTGKKFEQDQSEFDRFRDHYNRVLVRHMLPPLKGYIVNSSETCTANNLSLLDEQEEYQYLPTFQGYNTCVIPYQGQFDNRNGNVQAANINEFISNFRSDLYSFYKFGRGNL